MRRRSRHVRLSSILVWAFLVAAFLVIDFVAAGGEVLACPRCQPGQAARAAVFGSGFWTHVLAVALPFVVTGTAGAFLYRIGIRRTGADARPSRR
jgi:hypothetical protein